MKNDVPISFIELSLTQVIKAAFSLLISALLFGQWVEILSESQARLRWTIKLISLWAVAAILFVYFAQEGHRLRVAGFFATYGGVLAAVLICGWAYEGIRWRVAESIQVFERPTLTGALNLLVLGFLLCLVAWFVGFQGALLREPPVILDSGCGPVPQLIGRSGDALIVKLPPDSSTPTSFQLLSSSDVKTQRFRGSDATEIQFRNERFVGPCYPATNSAR